MLELDLLQVFVAVAERRGFTRAAQALHRTQSAVSMQMKRLEQAVGVPLLFRHGRRVRLTREGEVLIGYARRLLALGDEALGAMGAGPGAGSVRVGAIDDYATRVLPSVLAAFWRVYPGVQVELRTGLTGELLERLGVDYDLVVGMHPAGSGRGQRLRRDRYVWVGAKASGAHRMTPLPLALFPEGCLIRRTATRALDDAGRAWRYAYVTQNLAAIEEAVRADLAISVLRSATLAPGLRRLGGAQGFPALPEIEIALHVRPEAARPALLLAEHLTGRLSGQGASA